MEDFDKKLDAAVLKVMIANPTDADAAKVARYCCKDDDYSLSDKRVNQMFKGYVSLSARLITGDDVKYLIEK